MLCVHESEFALCVDYYRDTARAVPAEFTYRTERAALVGEEHRAYPVSVAVSLELRPLEVALDLLSGERVCSPKIYRAR